MLQKLYSWAQMTSLGVTEHAVCGEKPQPAKVYRVNPDRLPELFKARLRLDGFDLQKPLKAYLPQPPRAVDGLMFEQ